MSRLMLNLRALEKRKNAPGPRPMLSGLIFAKSSTGTTVDEGKWPSYSKGCEDDGTAIDSPASVRRGNVRAFRLQLSEVNCDENCTRDVLKAMGLDVREMV